MSRVHENEIAISILQPLPPDRPFNTRFTPPGTTVKDLLLQHCTSDAEVLESYLREWKPDVLIVRKIHVTMQPLVPLLRDPAAQAVFTRDCILACMCVPTVKLSGYLLKATQAYVWSSGQEIPESAKPYLEHWSLGEGEEDLPAKFALPQQEQIKMLLTGEETGAGGEMENDNHIDEQLGALVEKWASL